MAEKLQKLLEEIGSKLENPPANKDTLIKLLKQAATCLSEIEQSPPKAVLESMQPLINAIVKQELLKHHDKEVKLLVATCTCEITRVTAPEAPYDDEILKDIFMLIVNTFSGLTDTKGPSFGRRITILETVAKYRLCVVMLDLDCDDLINEMFRTFFAVASDEHSESVISSMKTIMVVLLEESEDINEDLLLIILSVLGRDKKAITTAARKLAMNVIRQCAGKLEPGIKQFIVKSMSGEASTSSSQLDYHEVIFDIYRCAPQALTGVVPYLSGELLNDKIEVRSKAVKLVGELFSIPGCNIPETFYPIFLEFLKRLTDRVVDIRMSVLEHVKLCMFSNPFRPEARQLIAVLCDRLLDYDESVRQKVVAVVSDIACRELASISVDTVKLVADRLRDKSLIVKKYTMERLSDIYRICCSDLARDDYDWIPGRILRCFYDKDFRSDTVEYILCTALFPSEVSVRDKVKTWVKLFSKFDKVEIKALEKILEQKQRLQLELQKYISLRKLNKESNASEIQKKITVSFRFMSHCFTDPAKAEADFLLLHQLKDANVWKILAKLLDPATTSSQSCKYRDELLEIVGQKHPLYGLLSILSMKCSYTLFNKDDVKELLLDAKSSGNKLLTQSRLNILVMLASFCPLLFSGTEKDLVRLLDDDNEVIKEGALRVLAKPGGTIRQQLGESSSTLDLILEKICLEGSRREAKYAVHALAAITKDDGLKSLSVLYKKLVEMLEKKTHLPCVLQSLGCIAQIAMPVFETQETKIKRFIKEDILKCSEKTRDKTKESWHNRTELCSLKIYGIKNLVKSYLPMKDPHHRAGIDELIKDLKNILSFGEISKDIESSSVDKAHLKLASAKAILRLSKHWDTNIPVDVFYLTLRTSEVGYPEVKKLFLNKIHQYIKDRSLDPKYACAFILGFDPRRSVQVEKSENRNLNDIIQMCQQGKARQVSAQSDGNSSVVLPDYILPFLIHALAHHPAFPDIDECKDVKAYEPTFRKLYLFFSTLALGDEEGKPGKGLKKEEVVSVLSILQSIRSSEDAVDSNVSKKLYAICDLCFLVTKRLAQKQDDLQEPLVHVSIPRLLYKPCDKKDNKTVEKEEDKKEDETKDDKKDEKEEENKEEQRKDEKEENEKADNKNVFIGQTWLGDANAIAHFESLDIEANDTVSSKDIVEDMLKDGDETDGVEVPLGKILERLKANKVAKERKVELKNRLKEPAAENNINDNNNNVDILEMVNEINLDNLGVPNKFVAINGHEKTKTVDKPKRKRIPTEKMKLSVTKRQRSNGLSAFDNIKLSDENDLSLRPSDLEFKSHIRTEEHVTTDDSNLEKPKKYIDTDGNKKSGSSNKKSGSIRKRKRTVSGLTKGTSKEGESRTTDLIGRRIKVWWPMDKEYYEGLVKSYDHQKKKHVVLYNDGDVEVISLDKERWKLIGDPRKPTKRNKSSKSPRAKKGLSKIEVSDDSMKLKEFTKISTLKSKRAPTKSTKQRRRTLEYFEVEKKHDPDMTEPEPEPVSDAEYEHGHEYATFSKVDTLDTDEETSDREEGKDAENRLSDPESSMEIEPDSRHQEAQNGSGSDQEVDEDKQSRSSTSEKSGEDNQEEEFSDDMLLGEWKSKVRKADERK
ncbi:sister chromatid cohesion protein PDS5 homolog A isoform X3 [Rutidosis leptorrhynchoides]|uniref:sister chromatid cohesion protein PDS5 homolog A isoform X3 n=1 Tax=Rutidosis leptorrhynchoides TaxID=125765 RepID=UPI003A993A7E